MVNNSPWSVKGVDPEAREAAKIAARRQSVPLGRWLTQTILSTAARELKTGGSAGSPRRPFAPPPPPPGYGAPPDGEAGGYGQGYDAAPPYPDPSYQQQPQHQNPYGAPPGGQPGHGPAPRQGMTSGPPALTPEAVLESIQKLASRIEESEARTADAIRPIADKIGALGTEIDEIKNRTGSSTAPVERAMMRLSERLDRIEEGSSGGRPSRTSESSGEGGFLGRLFGRD